MNKPYCKECRRVLTDNDTHYYYDDYTYLCDYCKGIIGTTPKLREELRKPIPDWELIAATHKRKTQGNAGGGSWNRGEEGPGRDRR